MMKLSIIAALVVTLLAVHCCADEDDVSTKLPTLKYDVNIYQIIFTPDIGIKVRILMVKEVFGKKKNCQP